MVKRITIPIIVLLLGSAAVQVLSGSLFIALIDIPSFLIIPVLALLYTAGSFGFRGIGRAYRAACSEAASRKETESALLFFKALEKNFLLFAAMTFGISLIAVLSNLGHPESLGPNLAVSILVILYGAFFNLLMVQPFLNTLKHRLTEIGG
ncbi:hypothetical protein LJC14_00860 [Treponema sp. OttesenSCG-928-L16]|nr:hypothetical protein [Treponema sp. OttesenSCG-928-L16]